jgi:hypothetical protein
VKRRATKLILFLLLGAIINVAVAWACATMIHPHDGHADLWTASPPWVNARCTIRAFGRTRVSQWQEEGRRVAVDYAGIPILGLKCENERDPIIIVDDINWTALPGNPNANISGGIQLGSFSKIIGMGPTWRALPLIPIWPGFAINTIFYAAILWLLFAAPGLIRRRRRIKRGLCPACAYPVGDSAVCTECGKPVG